jgi:hypothetical protein
MKEKSRKPSEVTAALRTRRSAVIALCLAALAAAVGWSLLSRLGPAAVKGGVAPQEETRVGRSVASPAAVEARASTKDAAASAAAAPAAPRAPRPAQVAAPAMLMSGASLAPTRRRSPLENSPGYVPPNDPESLSVITGRREAPAVDLPFAGGASSIDDLARRLVAAINARDERALFNLRVTRHEFSVILWPEFPESRPITNITADDAWEMGIEQNLAGVNRTIGSYGGQELELLKVETNPPQEFRNFHLYRGVGILVRERRTGKEATLHFAPSCAERLGRFKVLTYRDRE